MIVAVRSEGEGGRRRYRRHHPHQNDAPGDASGICADYRRGGGKQSILDQTASTILHPPHFEEKEWPSSGWSIRNRK